MRLRISVFFLVIIPLFLILPGKINALTVSPPSFEYSLNPGDVVLDSISILNEGSGTEIFYPLVNNFSADEKESGVPQFYPAEEDRLGQGLAKWISLDATPISIDPGQKKDIKFSINIPKKDVQPGGHYGAILFSTRPPTTPGSSVGITSQISVIILAKVAGEVKEAGNVVSFTFENQQDWFDRLPVNFELRFENNGNTHLKPTGDLIIKNWFGKTVAVIKVNPDSKSTLPMSIRKYVFGWSKLDESSMQKMSVFGKEWRNFALGKYTARLSLNYGESGKILSDERTFYVWPWRLMIIFSLSFLFLITSLLVVKHFYDKSLLRRYERKRLE